MNGHGSHNTCGVGRDPLHFSPVFVLAPARSNSSVVVTMLGQHPALRALPELGLFRANRVAQLLREAPHAPGPPVRARLAGVLRALAFEHEGVQTSESIERAYHWLAMRPAWHGCHVLDHLLNAAAPRIGVEKSPENVARDDCLARLAAAYPRARYLHLVRHPVSAIRSMYRVWKDSGAWDVTPLLFGQFCVGIWYHQHERIARFALRLPPGRMVCVRSEDVVNYPRKALAAICRWLGVDAGNSSIERMLHPERSPFARIGPSGAMGGLDPGFLESPRLRRAVIPETFDLPTDWTIDPWFHLAVVQLATRFGYSAQLPTDQPLLPAR